MPKRFAKRRISGGKRRVVRGRRRLTSGGRRLTSGGYGMAMPSAGYYSPGVSARQSTRTPRAPKKRRSTSRFRGNRTNATAAGSGGLDYSAGGQSMIGKNTIPPVRRGKYSKSGSVKRGIKRQIMEALIYGTNPIMRSDIKTIPSQVDWPSGQQGHATYLMATSPQDIEKKVLKSRDALYYNTAVTQPPVTSDVTSSRITVFPSTYILNMKNTCSHTIYVDARVYKAKGYHYYSSVAAWNEALATDNVVQNANTAPYPTEETILSLYKRPDMKSVFLNTRYAEMKSARGKWILEPGQESKFIFKMPGFTYDQGKYNILIAGQEPTRCPQSYELQLFCHSEMVTGAIDNDVCPGSGHLAVNQQLIESWQALPTVKKYQNIASYGWGDITQADEQDVNTDDVQAETYFENE